MEKNIPHRKPRDGQTVSGLQIWRAIRYLDPDMDSKTGDVVGFILLPAVVLIVPAFCVLLRLRGL